MIPPAREPVADAVHAVLAAADLSVGGVDVLVERGGTALVTAADRAAAGLTLRLAVRVANRPEAPGYAGAESVGDFTASAGTAWVRVELRAAGTDRIGARTAVEQVLRLALLNLAAPPNTRGELAGTVTGARRNEGPSAITFDDADESWTGWAVVEALVRSDG